MRFLLVLLVPVVLISCKKAEWKGVYSGTEELNIVSNGGTINSSFQQTVTIDFTGSKCKFNSSTLIWEFDRKQKTKTGYLHDETGQYFSLEFNGDSLIATYINGDLEYTERIFRGKK